MPQTYVASSCVKRPVCNKRPRDQVAEREERRRRRHDEERDVADSGIEAGANGGGDFFIAPDRARHHRQLGRRNRHPEQADRQQVNELRVHQSRDGAGRQQAGQQRVDISADLRDAPADEHRPEVSDDFTNMQRFQIEVQAHAGGRGGSRAEAVFQTGARCRAPSPTPARPRGGKA